MKVILRADVGELGKRGDMLEVADGYARNYLLPRGLALQATDGAVSQAAAMRRARDVADSKARAAAEDVAKTLVPAVITVPARAGAEGRLFGSVTTIEIAEAVAEQTGLALDRRRLHLDEPIKSLGTHEVKAKLHADVEFVLTVEVVPDR